MSYDCSECSEEFSSELSKLQHELDEHGEELSSHAKSQKKEKRNKLQQQKQTKDAVQKKKLKYMALGVLLTGVVAGGGFFAAQSMDFSRTTNSSIGVGEPVHWHADYDIEVCGEQRILQGGPIQAHTHGESTFHLEGLRNSREQATLDWVVDELGGEFSNKGILGYTEPESCPGSNKTGEMTVEANGKTLEDAENYIVRDGDQITNRYG